MFYYFYCYIKTGKADKKIAELAQSDYVYDKITLGILYISTGQKRRGINLLDEVCANDPDLLITPAVRKYIADTLETMEK